MQRLQLPQTVRRRPLPAVCRPRATQRQPLLPPPAGTDLWALRGENLICLLCIVEFVFGFGIFFFLVVGVVGLFLDGRRRRWEEKRSYKSMN